jgi:hypothetical protein
MSDTTRITKLPAATIKEANISENSATPAAEQKQTQTGIASAKDSFQVKQESSLFTVNQNTGEVKFGDGLAGKRPPTGASTALLYQSKSEISNYLKAEAKTDFGGMKEYLLQAQNQQINSAIHNLKNVALDSKNSLANNPALESRYKHFTSALNELDLAAKSQSKAAQQKANQQDLQTKRSENSASKDEDFAKKSQAHRDHIRDAVLDFLRKLHEMDPKI